MIGSPQHHMTKKGEDLLDVARHYDLGWTEIGSMYRQWDPWLPPPGVNMLIPTMWIVPTGRAAQIVVNTGELRLYYFVNNGTQVYTYPIGMGVLDFKTPTGNFHVNQKKVNPDWHIPKQLQKKYEMAVMPAGPDNPMGAFKLGLNWGDYGIHGCNLPWAVGRLVSHGCTRLYPEDIKKLFAMVPMGTKVEYIYEPAKIGFRNGRVFLSVHDDVYFKIRSMLLHVLNMIERQGCRTRWICARCCKRWKSRPACPWMSPRETPALGTPLNEFSKIKVAARFLRHQSAIGTGRYLFVALRRCRNASNKPDFFGFPDLGRGPAGPGGGPV